MGIVLSHTFADTGMQDAQAAMELSINNYSVLPAQAAYLCARLSVRRREVKPNKGLASYAVRYFQLCVSDSQLRITAKSTL